MKREKIMNKFSDFAKTNLEQKNNYVNSKQKVEDYMCKYSNLSQEELMKEFLKVSNEKKRNGGFSASEINNIKSTLAPFLNDEQKLNLDNLINMVK